MSDKKYFDIYSIESRAKKLHDCLEDISKSKPRMYQKSKQRYQEVEKLLLESAELIHSLLKEDVNPSEFKKKSAPKPGRKMNNVSREETIKYFDEVLLNCSMNNFKYDEVNICAKMLYKWFHTRFILHSDGFKYNIDYLPSWIYHFIILYGKYHSTLNLHTFYQIINRWCDDLEDGTSCKYAIPYQVFQISKSSNSNEFTIDAVVIYDLLFDDLLIKLSEDEFKGVVTLEYNEVAKIVKDKNPSIHQLVVTRFANQKQLVQQLGFTLVGDIDTDEQEVF